MHTHSLTHYTEKKYLCFVVEFVNESIKHPIKLNYQQECNQNSVADTNIECHFGKVSRTPSSQSFLTF